MMKSTLAVPSAHDDETAAPRRIRSTTVLCVRRDNKVVMAGDGQVTLGESVIKHGAKKIRRLYQDKILAGFAGSTADAFTLFSRFEAEAGAVSRQPRPRRRRTGQGLAHRQIPAPSRSSAARLRQRSDVPAKRPGRRDRARYRIAAIGSGGPFAQAAAQALADHTQLSAREIAEEAMKIAGRMCIYTNDKVTIEEL